MNYIFDFDSTFIKTEGLEELADLALAEADLADKDELIKKISDITDKGMNGELGFTDSLKERLVVIPATKKHVEDLAELLRTKVSESFARNKDFFLTNADSIYVFSGGFKDFIIPTLLDFGLKEENIFANTFVYDENGTIVGFDEASFLSQENGKAKQLRALDLEDEVVAVGDGWSDYEMKLSGGADYFVAFTENVRREKVATEADLVVDDLDKLIAYKF